MSAHNICEEISMWSPHKNFFKWKC